MMIEARMNYRKLLDKWKASNRTNPANDCLAIARSIFCAKSFPRCESEEKVNIFLI